MEAEEKPAISAGDAPLLDALRERWVRAPRAKWWFVVGLVVALVALGGPLFSRVHDHGHDHAAVSGTVDHYTCSMHSSVQSAGPGTCPLCGMTLTLVTAQQAADGVISVDEARQRLGGVRTVAATSTPLHLTFTGNGRVTYDEASLYDVTVRAAGYVSELFVDRVGEPVEQGQPLLSLASADLYAAQRTYLQALVQGATSRAAIDTRAQLSFLGLSDAQLEALAASREPLRALPILAPARGYVILKEVVRGARVTAGSRAYRIAATDRVWLEADVYDRDMLDLQPGHVGKVTLDFVPGHVYDAQVVYVYPYIESSARTGRVRLAVDNANHELRPGMYATVQFETEAGPRLQVPASAVVYTGPRRLVFVSLGDGRFRPQEVGIGRPAAGMLEITSGLEPGQLIAATGTFLLAAEARITTSVSYWDHEPEPAPQPSAAPSLSCPMHPEVQSAAPGTCPKCGMALVPQPTAAATAPHAP